MDYFRWQPAPSLPAVQLRWAAMEGIQGGVIEGFKALPRRGAEVGGALLGHRNPDTGDFTIESFEPIPIEYESGPSYILSARDMDVWRDRIAELRKASPGFVGLYRSQTRPGLLVMPDDCARVEGFLPREEGVLLLIKPLSAFECVGAFFLCDGGAVLDEAIADRQFPFGAPAGVTRPSPAKKASEEPAAAPAAGVETVAPAAAPHPQRKRLSPWIPITAATVGIGLALLFHYRQNLAAENPITATAPPVPQQIAQPVVQTPPPEAEPAAPPETAPNSGKPINSSSDRPIQKPVRRPAASPPAGNEYVDPSHRFEVKTGAQPQPGRVKRAFNGIKSKASHIWPFRPAKPAQQTR